MLQSWHRWITAGGCGLACGVCVARGLTAARGCTGPPGWYGPACWCLQLGVVLGSAAAYASVEPPDAVEGSGTWAVNRVRSWLHPITFVSPSGTHVRMCYHWYRLVSGLVGASGRTRRQLLSALTKGQLANGPAATRGAGNGRRTVGAGLSAAAPSPEQTQLPAPASRGPGRFPCIIQLPFSCVRTQPHLQWEPLLPTPHLHPNSTNNPTTCLHHCLMHPYPPSGTSTCRNPHPHPQDLNLHVDEIHAKLVDIMQVRGRGVRVWVWVRVSGCGCGCSCGVVCMWTMQTDAKRAC